MSHVFMVHIGPVQGFIASARRTRDLWFGSWLLSALAKAAVQEIVAQHNGAVERLIFPALENTKQLQEQISDADISFPNKIVAWIHKPPAELGQAVRDRIHARLNEIRDAAYSKIEGDFNKRIAEQQVADLVEYFWVAVPFTESDEQNGRYAEKRKRLEALMAARKNTRDFDPVSWGDNIQKSSISGQLESVIPEATYPRRNSPTYEQDVDELFNKYGAGPAERLSGVDLLKRHGMRGDESRFLSTSHVAALPFMQRVIGMSTPELQQSWDVYAEQVPKKVCDSEQVPVDFAQSFFARTDGGLLFMERLIGNHPEYQPELETAQKKLQAFFQKVGIGQPDPYYAIVHADGDRMGAVIDTLAKDGIKKHRELSEALNTFAQQVHGMVRKHGGALIYAGGDDVLAFVPLHTVLDCVQELSRTFCEQLSEFKDEHKQSPTLSVGVAIVHHLVPLTDAVELARKAEQLAKGVKDKNALAIIVSKRGGGAYEVKGKWGEVDEQLQNFIHWHREGYFPQGAAHELKALDLRLSVDPSYSEYEVLQKVKRSDALRILKRKRVSGGEKAVPENVITELQKIIEKTDGLLGTSKDSHAFSLTILADMLLVAKMLAKAQNMALGEPPQAVSASKSEVTI
ncbi:MAG: type III-B CRISPR-associated protein Cas10/Cmr2 [Chloroflexi bacterium AL-W]|nr:type III-B CRISPR-associated protein Cas10/Cmr2 [Chloroflexi bacterium AL-N1]NOK66637.1 type III-B CRISPR-associated protein Cas10/Cmr2 [Chloroflexi bacterium AL-N10]NOK72025.1 type III-B CRISPR-associated protein Cas10/Cmr2 [Chloroflexi bacterium AL-N5]NOK81282.1 type III-B CRISPR-associated protein Cas10/Cmr2 [Chloroflexi bacterium AL-W]NOK89555.1 type III-B CRISPR-associated protein Cas10/Cmr2 [Chloroflexi bacterium AL-N15]